MAEPLARWLTNRAQPCVSPSRGVVLSDSLHPSLGTDLEAGQASSHAIIAAGAWWMPYVIYPIAPVRTLRFREAGEVFLVMELYVVRSVLQS